jgi:hypothetical protein
MFSAQLFRYTDERDQSTDMKTGMNVPESDVRQFLLNVMHEATSRLNAN